LHKSIVNVPTSLDLVQSVLPRLLHDDYASVIFEIEKLEYKSIYMSSYIQPNIVIKPLYQLNKTQLYVNANILVRHDWEALINLANACQNDNVVTNLFNEALNTLNIDKFEKIINKDLANILVQNILIDE